MTVGEPVHGVYAGLDGYVCHCRRLEEGGRQIIGLILPGDFSDYRRPTPGGEDIAATTKGVVGDSIGSLQASVQTDIGCRLDALRFKWPGRLPATPPCIAWEGRDRASQRG